MNTFGGGGANSLGKKHYKYLTDDMMREISDYAIECYNAAREHSQKERYDKRLHNTKLLLKNYRELVRHSQNAIYETAQLDDDSLFDILDVMGISKGNHYIESIKASTERTQIILAHVNKMLMLYRIYCENSSAMEDKRRFRVLNALYIQEPPKTREQIAKDEFVDVRTIARDVKNATEKITFLLFGIDGIPQ